MVIERAHHHFASQSSIHSLATTDHASGVKETSFRSLMRSGSTRTLSPMLSVPRLNTRNMTYTVKQSSLLWLEFSCICTTKSAPTLHVMQEYAHPLCGDTTYPAILVLAHEERRTAGQGCRLDLDEIVRRGTGPCLRGEVPLVDEKACEYTVVIAVCDIGCLSSRPGFHTRVFRMSRYVSADCALPVVS